MTRTEILELAKQAGGTAYTNRHYDGTAMAFGPDALERFAALVAAKEREAAAMVCESWAKQHGKQTGDCAYEDCDLMATAIGLAQAIRSQHDNR